MWWPKPPAAALLALLAALPLGGCDGAPVRKAVADCQLRAYGIKLEDMYESAAYRQVCMASHGYILVESYDCPGPWMSKTSYGCYRRDNWIAEQLVPTKQ